MHKLTDVEAPNSQVATPWRENHFLRCGMLHSVLHIPGGPIQHLHAAKKEHLTWN